MKKFAFIALLLIAALGLTACGGPATFAEANTDKLVTLGEYKGLSYTPTDTSVSDYEVTVALNNALNEKGYAKTESGLEIKEGTVQVGDTVNIDYRGLKDGVAFDGGTAEGQSLTIGSGQFIDGFEEGLVGKTIGSDVNLNLTFPENYGSELAGQAVVFEVTINSVTTRVTYSELTDSLANELNEEVTTVEDYMTALKAGLENEKKEAAEETDAGTLWTAAVGNATFGKLPKKLVETCLEEFNTYFEYVATQYSYEDLDSFITAQGWTKTYFEEQGQLNAESTVKSQLAAYAIAKAEGFTITDEVFDTSVKQYAADAGYTDTDQYIKAVGEDAINDQIVLDYAMDLVITNAKAK